MNLEVGNKINVVDCSWAYLVTDKLEEHSLSPSCGMENWTVVATNVNLPTPNHAVFHNDNHNDTIIRKGNNIAFIHSNFLKLLVCPTCHRPME